MTAEDQIEQEPLMPEAIEKFVPTCSVCTKPVPANRHSVKFEVTCSKQCFEVVKAWRRYQLWRRACPNCRRPSSPAEREDFLKWRRSNGLQGRGRPPVNRLANLTQALTDAIAILKTAPPELMTIQENISAIARFQKLVDSEAQDKSKLRPKATTESTGE